MNSRQLARTWPFPRYGAYQRAMRKTATAWFDEKGPPRDSRYSFILDDWEHWPQNMILAEVAEYIERYDGDGSTANSQQGTPNFQVNGERHTAKASLRDK